VLTIGKTNPFRLSVQCLLGCQTLNRHDLFLELFQLYFFGLKLVFEILFKLDLISYLLVLC